MEVNAACAGSAGTTTRVVYDRAPALQSQVAHAVPLDSEHARILTRAAPAVHDGPATALQRSFSASTLDSLHSVDHGTLDAASDGLRQPRQQNGASPWVVYDGLPGPTFPVPGRYLAHTDPVYHIDREASPADNTMDGPDVAVQPPVRPSSRTSFARHCACVQWVA